MPQRSVYICISELASIAPIACGQYFWIYMLGPPKYKKALSYVVGWLTSLAWIATVATESLFAGTIVQGLLIISYPGYVAKQWHGTLLTVSFSCGNMFGIAFILISRFFLFVKFQELS